MQDNFTDSDEFAALFAKGGEFYDETSDEAEIETAITDNWSSVTKSASQTADDLLASIEIDMDIFPALDGDKLDENRARQEREDYIFEQCAMSRIFFSTVVLGMVLEDWQRELFEALDDGETKISISSGNGVGKTCACAVLAVHYLLFRNDVKIPVTSPSSSQLKDGLIPECIKWIGKLPDFLRNRLSTTSDRIVRVDSPQQNFISFRTARKEKPEALAGIHARFVMALVDEASGVDDTVYEAASGTMSTAGAIFIMIGNPTRLEGLFFRSHHELSDFWYTKKVSSFDTSMVDHNFVETIKRTYGEGSNQWKIRILGEFPSNEEDTLISRAIALDCVGRDIVAVSGDDVYWGVDCGRGGDNSSLLVRRGSVVEAGDEWNYSDTMATVGRVKQFWDDCPQHLRPVSINVDSIGIGAGVADRLRELGLPALDVNVSESPSMKGLYPRLRDELWYLAKEVVESRTCAFKISERLPYELAVKLAKELSTPIAIYTSTGKNGVESKTQMRQRGVKSPNLGDAFCLTMAYTGGIVAGRGGSSSSKAKKPLSYVPANIW